MTAGGAGFSVSVSSAVDLRDDERRRAGTEEVVVVARRAARERADERAEKALASMMVVVSFGRFGGATVQIKRARAAWDRRGIIIACAEEE